jgi:Helix-turn-helix domain
LRDPYEVLGLQAGAGRLELNRAYQRLKELYSLDSLAIYSLMTDSERKDRLEKIESAFQSINASLRDRAGDNVAGDPGVGQPGSVPDPVRSTGAYLRWKREQAGLSIGQLVDRTKIGATTLEDIETERVDRLPPRVYLRGFVYEFARCLGLADAFQLSEFYMKRVSTGEE